MGERSRMIASVNRVVAGAGGLRCWWWLVVLTVPFVSVAAASWWFTEPLTDHGAPGQSTTSAGLPVEVPAEVKALVAEEKKPPTWPDTKLAGRSAKVFLLDILSLA